MYRFTDIITYYGGKTMEQTCCESSCEPRRFITKDEKVEKLKEYQESLKLETKGVQERIKQLEKED